VAVSKVHVMISNVASLRGVILPNKTSVE